MSNSEQLSKQLQHFPVDHVQQKLLDVVITDNARLVTKKSSQHAEYFEQEETDIM